MGAACVLCCEGRGGPVQGSADRGAFLCRVVVVRWSGRRGSVPRRRGARLWLPRLAIRWVGRLWCGTKLSRPVLGGVLRGWVRAPWKTVAADGSAWPSVFVTLRPL